MKLLKPFRLFATILGLLFAGQALATYGLSYGTETRADATPAKQMIATESHSEWGAERDLDNSDIDRPNRAPYPIITTSLWFVAPSSLASSTLPPRYQTPHSRAPPFTA